MRVEGKNARDDEMVGRRRTDDPVDGVTNLELRVVVNGAADLPAGKGPDHDRVAARRAYLRLIARRLRKNASAFSVIELMVVIAVIAMLAGLMIGVLPGVLEKRKISRVRAELATLMAAIEYYKDKHGFYPPDTSNNIVEPPLFYELVGTTNAGGSFYPLNGDANVAVTDIRNAFKTDGFLNSSESGEVKNFYKTLRSDQYNWSPYNPGVRVLVVPADGPRNPAYPGAEKTNTWRYIAAKPVKQYDTIFPTNNPNSYDLWAEVVYRGKTNIIGNWDQVNWRK